MRVISQSGSSGIQWDTSVGCLGNDGLGSTRYVARTVSACVLFLHFKTPFCTFLSIRRISNHCRKRVRVQLSKLLCCGLKTRKFAGQNRKLAGKLGRVQTILARTQSCVQTFAKRRHAKREFYGCS